MAKILKKLLLWLTSITAILLFICFTAIAIFYHSCVVAPQKRIENTQETPYDFINSIKITDDEIIIEEIPSSLKSVAAEALQHYIHQKMPDGFLKRITRPKKKQVGESSSNSISKDTKQARINLLTLFQLRSIAIHKDYILINNITPFFSSLRVGDYLTVHPSTAKDYLSTDDFTRKITAIEHKNDIITLKTEIASLRSIKDDWSFHMEKMFTTEDFVEEE